MLIIYLKLLLTSLTSISKGNFNEWPGSLCNLSAASECTEWQSCPPVRARERVDIGTVPKVCAGLEDDVSCPMRKHLLSAWSAGEQRVSITHTGSQERDIIPTAPLICYKQVFLQTALMHSRYYLSFVESIQTPSKNYSRLDDMYSAAICLIVSSNKAVIKCEPRCQFLFPPYPVLQSCSYKRCSCIQQSRRKDIPVCLFSWEYKHRWWADGDQSLPTLESVFSFRPGVDLQGKTYSSIPFIQVAEDNLCVTH